MSQKVRIWLKIFIRFSSFTFLLKNSANLGSLGQKFSLSNLPIFSFTGSARYLSIFIFYVKSSSKFFSTRWNLIVLSSMFFSAFKLLVNDSKMMLVQVVLSIFTSFAIYIIVYYISILSYIKLPLYRSFRYKQPLARYFGTCTSIRPKFLQIENSKKMGEFTATVFSIRKVS